MVKIMLPAFIKKHSLPEEFNREVEEYYQPFADQVFSQFAKCNGPYFVGINGCQGSGKSTLTDFVANYLTTQYQLNVVVMSLDDFYLSSDIRQELAQNIHPLLAVLGQKKCVTTWSNWTFLQGWCIQLHIQRLML